MGDVRRAYCIRQDGTSVGHVDSWVCAQASAGGYKKQQLAAAKSKTSEIVHKLMIQSPACRFGRQITGTVGDLHRPVMVFGR